MPDEDNYCTRITAEAATRCKYDSSATVQSPNKRSRAGTIDQQNHNTFHSKLASTTSEAVASCQHEERTFYEQEIGKFKADLRTLEEVEEQVRTSPSRDG